jgi:ribosomal protein S18 acetylase RimI-like enzyme
MPDVKLRPAAPEDADFLYGVLKATMQEYVAQTWGWDEEWQQAHFREHFDPSKDQVIVLKGEDIGVLSVEPRQDHVFLSKIYILPQYQRLGIGTRLIRAVLERAHRRDVPVTLRVIKVNPARRLYERLGFVQVGETESHYLMKAVPCQGDAAGATDGPQQHIRDSAASL